MVAIKNSPKSVKSKKLVKPTKTNKISKSSTLNNVLKNIKNIVSPTQKSSIKKIAPLEKITNCFNKSQLIVSLSERCSINKKDIKLVLDQLFHIMGAHLKKNSPEKFVFPGAFKIVVRKIAAKKARSGINPFTGETTTFKAKPASRKVKIIPLKGLKDMAI